MDSASGTFVNMRLKAGDVIFFEHLYREYYTKTVFFANQYLKNEEEAQSVAQDAFVTLWEKRASINPQLNIRSFILTIVKNQCLNLLRKHISEKKYADHLSAQEETANYLALRESPVDDVHAKELEKLIEEALAEMPEKMSEVYRMNREQELSYDEIATELAVSVKTIEYRMSKALVFFRSKLKDYLAIPIFIMIKTLF